MGYISAVIYYRGIVRIWHHGIADKLFGLWHWGKSVEWVWEQCCSVCRLPWLKVIGNWRKLHNVWLHKLYLPPDIIGINTLPSGHVWRCDWYPMQRWQVTSFNVFLHKALHMRLCACQAHLQLQEYWHLDARCLSPELQTVFVIPCF
jgi:hypothetical protein